MSHKSAQDILCQVKHDYCANILIKSRPSSLCFNYSDQLYFHEVDIDAVYARLSKLSFPYKLVSIEHLPSCRCDHA